MIYFSTGYFKNLNFHQVLNLFKENKINFIEFSGGRYQPNLLKMLKKKDKKTKILFHNYFPVPKKPIIINLSSSNKSTIDSSIKLIKRAIDYSYFMKAKYYSVHAGYLIDMDLNDFGKVKKKKKLISREAGVSNFIKNITIISNYAKRKNIEILVENNVIGKTNFKKFKLNPFLMSDLEETRIIMNNTPKNVNLLLDLGHLKVSSNILNFDKFEMLEECKKWTKAYHLSENNGYEDENLEIKKNSWFINRLKKVKFYSLEVYSNNFKIIHKQINLLKRFI